MDIVFSVNLTSSEEKELRIKTGEETLSKAISLVLNKLMNRLDTEQQLFYASKKSSKKRWVWIDTLLYKKLERRSVKQDISMESATYTAILEEIQGS